MLKKEGIKRLVDESIVVISFSAGFEADGGQSHL
jgi:hypothetical protein